MTELFGDHQSSIPTASTCSTEIGRRVFNFEPTKIATSLFLKKSQKSGKGMVEE
jgi:hypothetical protein